MRPARFDLVSMGRSSIDLYSNDIGAPFPEIKSFAAFVGGCPTNISVGVARLGFHTALLTAVGDDPVGDFVVAFLEAERVETKFIARKPGYRTSAVLLGIEPPDKFPLVFYRHHCADMQLDCDDVLRAPLADTRTLLITGTGLSKEPSRSANLMAAELAHANGATVFLDLDFRADQWSDLRAYGLAIRSILRSVEFVIGTEAEIKAAAGNAPQVSIEHAQISDPQVTGNLQAAMKSILADGPKVLVLKQGGDGAEITTASGEVYDVASFEVEICNLLGAGDAFASGFIYGYLKGWELPRCARMGSATGAIVVTRQGCANFMPFEQEALDFVERHGGF